MCILFLKSTVNPNPNEYSLILVNVRDEYYDRPTQCCAFWDQNKQLYGARDLHEGRGGTWLSMNTSNGKIGVLLNILQPDSSIIHDKKSRGYLVVDFLTGNHSPQTYLEEVSKNCNDYNQFVLVTMQVNRNTGCTESSYFSNVYNCEPLKLDYGIHAFGNNEIHNQLWSKVSYGKTRFEQLVNKYSTTTSKPQLINEIFNLLSEKEKHPLDNQIKRQGNGKPLSILEKLNCINVDMPEIGYGSRTWTVILIDGEYNVDYIEKTKMPITIENGNTEWITTENRFNL